MRDISKYKQIRTAFEELGNSEIAVKMAAYMRNQFRFYGIPTPQRRTIYKSLFKAEKKRGIIDWDFIEACWADEHREFQYVALDYLWTMQEFLTYADISRLEPFARTKQWWDSIDGLDRIIGDIGLSDPRISGLMIKWSTDEDFWIRRISIDHQLGRKTATDTRLLETVIVNNFGSSEFFINKAIGWSLREYSKTDPQWVRQFIGEYGDRMSSLSIREGSKYI